MKNKCVFCESDRIGSRNAGFRSGGERQYWLCTACGGIFLDAGYRLQPEEEKKRYELHENTLSDPGYRAHLGRFMAAVLSFPEIRVAGNTVSPVRTVFDYGSGPEPCLARLFETAGYAVRYRDPFFCPDTPAFEGGADLVTCLEVAEHFAEPRRDFELMAECLREGGLLALGTHLLAVSEGPGSTSAVSAADIAGDADAVTAGDHAAGSAPVWRFFESWWYRQDATHISFYTAAALRSTAESAGLEWLGQADANIWMFRKRKAVSR